MKHPKGFCFGTHALGYAANQTRYGKQPALHEESEKFMQFKPARVDHLKGFAHQYQPSSFQDGLIGRLFTINCPSAL
jgi:hypothetical protein